MDAHFDDLSVGQSKDRCGYIIGSFYVRLFVAYSVGIGMDENTFCFGK
jgi:hypothetical protein